MTLSLITMMILTGMSLMNWNNVSIMILLLIIMTTAISLSMTKCLMSVWVGFSLFLVFVGGLMILFILIASMIPNNILKSTQLFMTPICLMFLLLNTNAQTNMSSISPSNMFEMKIQMLLMIIMILNLILILITKMIMSPIKPYRSIEYSSKFNEHLISNQKEKSFKNNDSKNPDTIL